jgi:hypothetical protein
VAWFLGQQLVGYKKIKCMYGGNADNTKLQNRFTFKLNTKAGDGLIITLQMAALAG